MSRKRFVPLDAPTDNMCLLDELLVEFPKRPKSGEKGAPLRLGNLCIYRRQLDSWMHGGRKGENGQRFFLRAIFVDGQMHTSIEELRRFLSYTGIFTQSPRNGGK